MLMTSVETITPQKTIELLRVADHQAERLERLAVDLLDLARLEQGRLQLQIQEVALNEVISSAVSLVAPEQEVEINVDPSLRVKADPQRLEQIVVNLVTNALRYGEPPFEIEAESFDGKVAVEFRDHGPGIPAEEREELFQSFRSKDKKGSVGLGLAIVKALAEAQDGDVHYVSNSPAGASFKVALPRAETR
jgi:signal transduction histidine kinase